MAINLKTQLGKLTLQNPVMVASGTFGYGEEYARVMDVSQLGAIITKSITLAPRAGNKPPRIYETASGMLNAIGLQNVGVEAFIRDKMPFLRGLTGPKILVNLAGESVAEYVELARRLDDVPGIDGFELNISCPNCDRGGMEFGVDPRLTREVVRRVRRVTKRFLMPKLSPNVTDVVTIAQHAVDGGADALSLINTLVGIAVDATRRTPRISTVKGGLSGPAIKPVALRMVWQVHRALPKVPLVGLGGIMTAEDAAEFLLCGASAVQIGTANYVDPKTSLTIVQGLARYAAGQKVRRVSQLVGTLRDGR
ncbi:MAG: dihydroorotate dehydrogenase B catalytic subunit [Omnitrophica WOR_2 bacterium RIFCSPHIGHO2_02_FULL_68_15]|nr:MAG: dihydroorotate dehydrogenase B catalytic subunit [Omnitrophica WOR_2 bacterium RIFCSPHIGHO2_02_FULL_68_15]